ncbi:MAG: DUF3862 domain-containing protein [Idiomarina sp.]|nr:DUF3862 domain-containing protein [Idiomarina sp.]
MKTITLLIVALLLIGCGNPKVNRTNYHMIDVGMRLSELEHMLGQPDWCDDYQRPTECRWGTDDKHIEVTFVARRVVATKSTGL